MKAQLHIKILISVMDRKLLLLFAILNFSIASAQTFTVDGIKYTVIPITTNVEVVQKTPAYTGVVAIPSSVIYNSVTYAVTAVGPEAFFYCTDLTSIAIPNSVASIGSEAFSGCSGLTSITIPDSVTSIGYGIFSHCYSLSSVTIPNSVTSIGAFTFAGCTSLASVVIPTSVTSIEEGGFSGCASLTSVTIPNSVTSIGNFAFADCYALTAIIIPNSVISIGISSFQYCTSLTSVTIPNSVTSIDRYAFFECTSLTTVNCAIETPLNINADVFGNVNQALCTLNVPASSVSLYQAANVWQDFNPINALLSTNNFTNKNNIKIYPNPVSNNLTIESSFVGNIQLNVINNLGQVVLKQNQNSSLNSLDVSNLSKGLYFLNIATKDGNTQTIKFIKN